MEEIKQWYERDFTLEQAMDNIDANLRASVRNFVAIGFYLKMIRDRKLYEEEGYKNFEEFVRKHYDRDKGWASRCIKVNDQLSKAGNSPLLAEAYKEYKVSQLVELAYLTEEQRSLASPDMTVKEIQAIRKPEPEQKVVISQLEEEPDEDELPPSKQPLHVDEPEKVATSQQIEPDQEEQPKSVQEVFQPELVLDENSCPPGDWNCRRQEWGIGQKEQEIGHLECVKCWDEWKKRKKLLDAAALHQEMMETEELPLDPPKELTPIERGCITGLSRYGNCVCCGADGAKCCGQCDKDCNGRCGWIERPVKADKEKEEHEAFEEEKLPDEKWNLGDLPQAKDRYVAKLARAVVNEYGSRMIFRFGGLSGKEAVNMLTSKCGGDIDIGDDVKAYAVAEVIEFYSGDTDLGVCSYAKFVTQVQKALEDWKTENEKKNQEPEQETVIDTEFTEIIPEPAIYDKDIIKEMIHQEEQMLAELGGSWKKNRSHYYTKHTMMLDAYRMLQAAHEGGN